MCFPDPSVLRNCAAHHQLPAALFSDNCVSLIIHIDWLVRQTVYVLTYNPTFLYVAPKKGGRLYHSPFFTGSESRYGRQSVLVSSTLLGPMTIYCFSFEISLGALCDERASFRDGVREREREEPRGTARGTIMTLLLFFVLFFIRAIFKLYICIPTNCTQYIL